MMGYVHIFMKLPLIFRNMQKQFVNAQQGRSAVIHASNDALNRSKRAIFALHRGNAQTATTLLEEAKICFQDAERRFRTSPELKHEGSYQAAREEYTEAMIFADYLRGGRFSISEPRIADPQVFLAGLSDATGEIVRYAIRQATHGNREEVTRAHETIEMIIHFLLELDLTGYLRQKFDQGKKNLRTIEDILYDLSLKS
ncbi:MAG: hypothetical protein UU48_C0006G0100 [Candidatus Uhrbacteria bacterium GW2011_GWF2_41_16]|jgi:translin|uniref:Translin n=2 Tax=Candidatus Uhriibacteriota TaxID=1752732 RepID=A0A0G0XMN5_9BACT|nr:MAG: hypothetical protein UU35_C0007G0032 [Candidatus Uhrbacteria bacterium GW2011_GWC2_41_11]KKR98060.1 MAG: hypothetical protein UU48_C0006G0100 [Candidatus Uhrbacteria bacterium GW2011_GWF2_41_16]